MKIKVTKLSSCDVLVVGGTSTAILAAVEAKKSGKSVFVATPHQYFGEDICATLDVCGSAADKLNKTLGVVGYVAPFYTKKSLDKLLIDNKIDFLFQMNPVSPVVDKDGVVCGAMFASRSGFHFVQAKVVIDATKRKIIAEAAGVEMEKFVPGKYILGTTFVNGYMPKKDNLRFKPVKQPVVGTLGTRNQMAWCHSVETDYDFANDDMFTMAKALQYIRAEMWDESMVYFADDIYTSFEYKCQSGYSATKSMPIVIDGDNAGAEAIALCDELEGREPVSAKSIFFTNGENDYDVVRKDDFYRFKDVSFIEFELNRLPKFAETDVFVAGGGNGGAPAAIAAVRSGKKVICAETLYIMGGIMTSGKIGCYWYGNRVGFTKEIDHAVHDMTSKPEWDVDSTHFNTERKAKWFLDESSKGDGCVLFGTSTVGAVVSKADESQVCGAIIANDYGCGIVISKMVIDSTGASDVAAEAGAEVVLPIDQEPAIQGAGMSYISLGLNYANTDYLFIVDHDVVDETKAFVASRAKYAGGIFDTCMNLNTRERRRIVGDVVLQPQDFFANRTYTDTINVAYSNFDTHGFIIHPLFIAKPTSHTAHSADVPLRALLPRGIKGLLVTGLGISAHRDCMPLVRMQADVQNQGFAAGFVASKAIDEKLSDVRDVDCKKVQKDLVGLEILPERVLTDIDKAFSFDEDDPWKDAALFFCGDESAISNMKKRLEEDSSDYEAAMYLGLIGDKVAYDALCKSISETQWDEGWAYRGMGQFGPSLSRLDAKIFALAKIGGNKDIILEKLRALSFDMHFSHVRAICMALIANPDERVVIELERLLSEPGAQGNATESFEKIYSTTNQFIEDVSVRNRQLKEVYIARALIACDPTSSLAKKIQDEYKNGLDGIYVQFASNH